MYASAACSGVDAARSLVRRAVDHVGSAIDHCLSCFFGLARIGEAVDVGREGLDFGIGIARTQPETFGLPGDVREVEARDRADYAGLAHARREDPGDEPMSCMAGV